MSERGCAPKGKDSPYNRQEFLNICGAGNQFFHQKEYLKAILKFEDLLQLEPNYLPALLSYSVCLHQLIQFEKSNEILSHIIKLYPKNSTAYETLGLNFRKLKEYEKSIFYYQKNLEIQPNNHRVYSDLSIAYSYLKTHKQALENIEKSLEIAPKIAYYHRRKGSCLLNLKRYKEALKCYEKSLELSPNDGSDIAFNGIGLCYHRRWKFEKAIEMYDKAIEANQRKALYYNNKSGALFMSRNFVESYRVFRQYLDVYQRFPSSTS